MTAEVSGTRLAGEPRRRRFLLAAKKLFVRFSVGLTIALIIAQFSPLTPWCARWLAGPWNDPDGDILIVLTNEAQPDDIIGPVSYARAVYAIRAWRQGHFRAVVVSGGRAPGVHSSLAAIVGQFLAAYGIPKDRIFLEDHSVSTRENALYTKKMIASWPGKRVLLTSDIHMFRARRVFEAVGLPVAPRPFPDLLKSWNSQRERIPQTIGLGIEITKIAYYWARGWIRLF